VEGTTLENLLEQPPSSAVKRQAAAWIPSFLRRLTASDFARKVSGTFATRVFITMIGIVTLIIVTRILGPRGRGEYALAMALATLGMQLVNCGLHSANTFYVASDRTRLPTLMGNSLLVSLLLGTLFALGVGGLSWLFPGVSSVQGVVLVMALAWIPIGAAYLLAEALLVGTDRIRAYNGIEILRSLASIGLIAVLVITDCISVESAIAVGLLVTLISLVLALRSLANGMSKSIGISTALMKTSLTYGSYVYIISFASFLICRADLFLVEHFIDLDAAGIYSTAQMLAENASLFPETLGVLLFPKLVKDAANRANRTIKACLIAAAVLGVIFLLAVPFLKTVIQLVFGETFVPATTPALILIAAMVFYAVGNIVGAYILAHGKSRELVTMWIGVAIANLAANVVVIPIFGGAGAAVCLLGTYVVAMAVQIVIAVRIHQVGSIEHA
jgi:O-antigen/teichoic acid export membrane protein